MGRLRVLIYLIALFSMPAVAAAQTPSFDRVFIIVMENKEVDEVIGNPAAPYLNALAAEGGVGTNYTGVVHPSLPNYMAMTSGVTAFPDNCTYCRTDAANIVDRLEGKGLTWRAYMEGMPAGQCGADDSGRYVARHNPFVHYSNIVNNPARCANVVPFTEFDRDLSANTLPNYVWITPDLCSDMHDCPTSTGDAWLSALVPRILSSPAFANGVLFIVWDEGTTALGGGGRIPFIVKSRWTTPGTISGANENHYNLLRTIEDAWGLAPLGQSASATALTAYFSPAATPATQVIYAGDVTALQGSWRKAPDPTAAGGVKLTTPDIGVGVLPSPLASPTNYFDATFQAQAGIRYRVWFRIHPTGDSKWNDSIFAQFSDSVDVAGAPSYRIGTTMGYIVNLWTCADCLTHGWGWQRNAYWLSDGGDVWFPTSGEHTVRVQIREDGVEIDQIVISPTTFVNAAPGPVSDDKTIVPKPGVPPPPPTTPPRPEILLTASDVAASGLHGAWKVTSSASSPGGLMLTTPDNGVSLVDAPRAAPSDYVDVAFVSDANTVYTLWLRVKALSNNKYNDSVWVQFSDAQLPGGQAYPIGSTSALLVNLATNAAATSLNDWGWVNGAYWLSQPAGISFLTTGPHVLRIQTREDGVSIDQIVLSSVRYRNTPPGPVSGDATIVR